MISQALFDRMLRALMRSTKRIPPGRAGSPVQPNGAAHMPFGGQRN